MSTEILSRREKEVIHLMLEGWSNGEIARRLTVSRKTIDAVRTHILEKWGLWEGQTSDDPRNRTILLVKEAYKRGYPID